MYIEDKVSYILKINSFRNKIRLRSISVFMKTVKITAACLRSKCIDFLNTLRITDWSLISIILYHINIFTLKKIFLSLNFLFLIIKNWIFSSNAEFFLKLHLLQISNFRRFCFEYFMSNLDLENGVFGESFL